MKNKPQKVKLKIPALHSPDEGMKWKFEFKMPKKGEFYLNDHNEWCRVSGDFKIYSYLTARQAPNKLSLKKQLKKLGLPMPDKVKGYKFGEIKTLSELAEGGVDLIFYFSSKWISRFNSEPSNDQLHYIELIPTKKLAKAIAKNEESLKEIEKLTN